MSKFLFVSSFDTRRNTSGNIRLVALMKALHDAGHIVHCIFSPTDKVSDIAIFEALATMDRIITYPHVRFEPVLNNNRVASNPKNLKKKIIKLLIKLFSSITIYDVYKLKIDKLKLQDLSELDSNYDYVVSSADPKSSHVFAEKIIKLKHLNTKWIMYWGDPMTSDVSANKLFSGKIIKEEEKLISKSYKSVYTNSCAVEYMKRAYPKVASKITWIPTSDIKQINKNNSTTQSNRVGYFGDYSAVYRNIIPFYNACVNNEIDTIICGSGAGVTLESLGNVCVKGRVSRQTVDEFEKDCRILIVIENRTKTGECIQIPGKLYHYALTNKEILVITESSNLSKDYCSYNRFHFVQNEESKIKDAIQKILNNYPSSVKCEPLKDFMPDQIVKQFINIID